MYFKVLLNMENKHQDDLSHIRSMMERSSRFISLSGLSGICAGIAAIAGAAYAHYMLTMGSRHRLSDYSSNNMTEKNVLIQLLLDAAIVLLISLTCAIFFTISKSKRLGMTIWTTTTKHLLIQLTIPLVAGSIFCVALIHWNQYIFIAPSTLVFYGLALINASKFTYSDIMYLGLCETALGLTAMLFPGHGLMFWTIGFGMLHIIYGILMYNKYK